MLTKVANTPRYLVVMALGIVVTSSAAYAIAEHQGIGNAIYWALITATTVGYGDTYPKTPEGRVVAILLVFSMVLFFLPMVTASMASKLIVNRDAFTHEEQEELKESVRQLLRRLDEVAVAEQEQLEEEKRLTDRFRAEGAAGAAKSDE
jgi:voltage-gated potassium channel